MEVVSAYLSAVRPVVGMQVFAASEEAVDNSAEEVADCPAVWPEVADWPAKEVADCPAVWPDVAEVLWAGWGNEAGWVGLWAKAAKAECRGSWAHCSGSSSPAQGGPGARARRVPARSAAPSCPSSEAVPSSMPRGCHPSCHHPSQPHSEDQHCLLPACRRAAAAAATGGRCFLPACRRAAAATGGHCFLPSCRLSALSKAVAGHSAAPAHDAVAGIHALRQRRQSKRQHAKTSKALAGPKAPNWRFIKPKRLQLRTINHWTKGFNRYMINCNR